MTKDSDYEWPEECKRIYCISIRKDRLQKFKNRLGKLNKYIVKDDIAVKGADLDEKFLQFFNTKKSDPTVKTRNNHWGAKLTPGQIGCALSHMNCWQDILKNKYDCALILEDDARFTSEHVKKMKSFIESVKTNAHEFDILILQKNKLLSVVREKLGPNLAKAGPFWGTAGYLITKKGCKNALKSLELMKNKLDRPIDCFLSDANLLGKLNIITCVQSMCNVDLGVVSDTSPFTNLVNGIAYNKLDEEDIDAVVTWVDSTDPNWKKRKESYKKQKSNDSNRYPLETKSEITELGICVTSIRKFLPWIRYIWIVTERPQKPAKYIMNVKGVKIIHHDEIFKHNKKYLPTYNSNIIECHIHNIPGLTEHFMYFNDDTYVTNHTTKHQLFKHDKPVSPYRMELARYLSHSKGGARSWKQTLKNNHDLLKFKNVKTPRFMTHVAIPMSKTLLHNMWHDLGKYVQKTLTNRFRSVSDYQIVTLLLDWGVHTGDLLQFDKTEFPFTYKYFSANSTSNLNKIMEFIGRKRAMPNMFCINDNGSPAIRKHLHEKTLPLLWEYVNES